VFRDGQVTAELSGNLNSDDIIHATFGAPVEQTEKEVAG
jgi:hypothetical protein